MTSSASTLAVSERIVGHGAEAFDRVRSRLAALEQADVAGLARPTRVTLQPGDVVAVTERDHGGATLRQILDVRGSLRAGECVWWAARVAGVLARLHKAGLAHGALTADAVVIVAGDVTLHRLVDGAADASPASDIEALGALLASTVRADEADRVGAWTEPMRHADPSARPTAAMVARALPACATPEPVLMPAVGVADAVRAGAGSSTEVVKIPEGRWWRMRVAIERAVRRHWRPAAWAGAGLVAISVAWAVVAPLTGADAERTQTRHDWSGPERAADAAVRVTQARLDAMASGDGAALVALTADEGQARAEAEATAALLDAGRFVVAPAGDASLRPSGIGVVVVESPRTAAEQDDRAVVDIAYDLPAYTTMLDGVRQDHAAAAEAVRLELRWDAARGWVVEAVGQSRAT